MSILAVILGILAVACAFFATALFGTTGGIIAAVLAAVAIVLGILKRKKAGKGGIPAIVIGALAVILAFSMTNMWSNAYKELHQKAVELKPDGLWAQASENTNGGLMGIISQLPTDEASLNAFVEEMNELNKLAENP